MKTINLKNSDLDKIDLSHFDSYLMPKYKISHQQGGYGFYDKSGIEHYSVLAYLSTLYNNITILASGSQTIDGQNSVVLESPFASLQLYCNGANKYFIY